MTRPKQSLDRLVALNAIGFLMRSFTAHAEFSVVGSRIGEIGICTLKGKIGAAT